MQWGQLLIAAITIFAFAGCYSMRPSEGAGNSKFRPPREVNPADVQLPAGYRIEVVATNLVFPTGITFDANGTPYVIESGYAYGEEWFTPKLLRLGPNGARAIATGGKNGPWNGVTFHEGNFFIAEGGVLEGGRILKIAGDGKVSVLVSNLPSFGDHHTDGPVVGPDGRIYFGQGTASNSGVVGKDNHKFGWLARRPDFHDIPGKDIVLTGENFETPDILHPPATGFVTNVLTGAFVPFGTATTTGQVVKGSVPCSGGIMSIAQDGSDLQLVAWGFRNPFGLTFSDEKALYATDNGYDDRGSRPVWGASDLLWRVENNKWHGWPDYSGDLPVSDSDFKAPGRSKPKPLIANPPNVPPKPVARLGVHVAATGLDFSRSEKFGHKGDVFIALFGDETPTTGKVLKPAGCKVIRVNVDTGAMEDFFTNKGIGPASRLNNGGIERPVSVKFHNDALYVVDFGVVLHTKTQTNPQEGTGVIWKITKEGAAQ